MGTVISVEDKIDTKEKTARNSCILFITPTNRVILVRDKRTKEWMLPGGKRDDIYSPSGESDYECALREFREETSFELDRTLITDIKSDIRIHRNGSKTKYYIIHSTQRFPKYDPKKVKDYETDNLHYLELDDLKSLVNGTPHTTVKNLKDYVQNSLKDIFKKGII